MIQLLLTVALLGFCLPVLAPTQNTPRFEDYAVAVYTGRIQRPKWIHRGTSGEWRDKLGKLVEPPEINFAGRYFVSLHSCGTGCRYYTLTDLSTGRELNQLRGFATVEPPPGSDAYPLLTDLVSRPDSKLLVAQFRINGLGGEQCRERAFVLENGILTAVTRTRRPCTEY